MRLRSNLAVVAFALASASALAQNVTVLKNVKSRGRLSGCWGYTAPDGRELALIGDYGGTWVVETTDPTRPVERGFFKGPNSRWREITSYKQYVYSASEHHRGIRLLDLSDPGKPVDKGYVLTANITRTHSISIDPDAGLLYANGTNLGMVIMDVKTNPLAPRIVGRYTSRYVHDSFIRRGRAYVSDIYGGRLRILDIRNPAAISEIGNVQTPGKFTHNAWTTADDRILVTTDEVGSVGLNIYDISNKKAPVWKGTYVGASGEICHNAFVIGRVCYMAHNSDGFHACDLTDPTRPQRIGRYDTSSTTSGYNGMWGCYPFQDSGVIYGSDRTNGLFLFQLDCGHMNRYGAPTRASNGTAPRMAFDGASPRVGAGALRLEVADVPANAAFYLVLSAKRVAPFKLLGTTVHVDLAGAVWVRARADAQGRASLPAPIPNNAGLGGAKIFMQVFAVDATGPAGLTASRGMWAGICK